ncbi:Piwi domain-containing protein [Cladochytrium replicatum]|nr:Piwi domain-containing protein [Cladochytrium replicatum]
MSAPGRGRGRGDRGGGGGGGRGRGGGGRGGGGGEGSVPGPPTPTQSSRPTPTQTPLSGPSQQSSPHGTSSPQPRPVSTAGPSTSTELISSQMSTLSLDSSFVKRPDAGGKVGRPIRLYVNFFKMQIPDRTVYHYDVEILPQAQRDRPIPFNRRVFEAWKALPAFNDAQRKLLKLVVYDGRKNFYSIEKLNFNGKEDAGKWDVEVPFEDVEGASVANARKQKLSIAVKQVAIVHLERIHTFLNGRTNEVPRDAIAVIEVLLRERPSAILVSKQSVGGGSFFRQNSPQFPAASLSGGLVVQQGWYQATRMTIQKIVMLNLDVSATSFYPAMKLSEVVAQFLGKSVSQVTPADFQREGIKIAKFLKEVSVKVVFRNSGRLKYKIKALGKEGCDRKVMDIPPEDLEMEGNPFKGKGPSKVTVAEYYKKVYGITLKLPNWPPMLSGANHQIHLPIELVEVLPNQRFIGKLDGPTLADMIKHTAVPPDQRFGRIEEGSNVLHDAQGKALLKSWDVSVEPKPVQVIGRVLDPPRLTSGAGRGRGGGGRGGRGGSAGGAGRGGGGAVVMPQSGQWRLDGAFLKPAVLRRWAILNLDYRLREDAVGKFVEVLMGAMSEKGMVVGQDYPPLVTMGKESIEAALVRANQAAVGKDGGKADLIVVILTDGAYNEVKAVAETTLGLLTQCVLRKNVLSAKFQTAANIALKINTKLGGVNFQLDPEAMIKMHQVFKMSPTKLQEGKQERVLVFGADVTHPPPGAGMGISIAAVTANVDAALYTFGASFRVQQGRTEVIVNLEEMVKQLLNAFKDRGGAGGPPTRLVFYRDGVSEGQFNEVLLREATAIKRALQAMRVSDCKLTFVVINKRHHTRMLPVDPRDRDRSGNTPAGTVVDTDVVHPLYYDFYLTSHAGLQGTSKPSYYHVLLDESRLGSDAMQAFTYNQTYLFARCTRSVSMVPAAYYAHIVAARARCYFPKDFSEQGSQSSSSSAMENLPVLKEEMNKIGMFFV